MSYTTIALLRAEGVLEADYPDPVLANRILLADAYIERITEMFFDRRLLTFKFDGHDGKILHMSVPICAGADQITSVTVDDDALTETDDYVIYNRQWPDDRKNPRIKLDGEYPAGLVWTRGLQNVVVVGYFGYVDYDGDETWSTPAPIARVAMRLVMWDLDLLGDEVAQRDRRDGRITAESTKGRSITLSELSETGGLTGVREIDTVLAMYRRPIRVESVGG